MADLVTSQINANPSNGGKTYIATFTNLSDGTGESAVKKIDISGLKTPTGAAPTKVQIIRADYSIFGMSVLIAFDHTTDDTVMILSGDGTKEGTRFGGWVDPASAGDTGDVMFTTVGHSASDTYTITLEIRLS